MRTKTDKRMLVILTVVVILFFLPLFLALGGRILSGQDLLLDCFQLRNFINSELGQGRFPFWFPFSFLGVPLSADPLAFMFYPVDWISLLMPLNIFFSFTIILHALFCAFGVYFLARELDISETGSLLSAVCFSLGLGLIQRAGLGHLRVTHAAAYLPWILLCAELMLKRGRMRWAVAAGALFGLQLLAGEAQISCYTGICMAFFVLLQPGISSIPKRLGALLTTAAIGFGAASVQILPALFFIPWSNRSAASAAFIGADSLPPGNLLSGILPGWGFVVQQGSGPVEIIVNSLWEHQWYIGIIPLVLGLGFLIGGRTRARLRLTLAAIAFFFILVSLGRYTPLFPLLFKIMPGFNLFRIPSRAMILVGLMICLVSGAGLDAVIKHENGKTGIWTLVWSAAFLGVISGLVALLLFMPQTFHLMVPSHGASYAYSDPDRAIPVMKALIFWAPVSALCAALVLFPLAGNRKIPFGTIIIAITFLDLWAVGVPWLKMKTPEQLHFPLAREAIETYGLEKIQGRIWAPSWVFPPNEGAMVHARNIDGYLSISPDRTFTLLHRALGVEPDPFYHESLNARPWSDMPAFPFPFFDHAATIQQIEGTNRTRVLFNKNPGPRTCAVYNVNAASDPDQALDAVVDKSFDPWHSAWVEGADAEKLTGPPDSSGKVELESDKPGLAVLNAACERECLLVLTESFDPGWKVFVDQKPQRVFIANYAFLGVYLPPGNHKVEFRYSPPEIKIGALISLISVLALLIFGICLRRIRKPADSISTNRGK